MQLVASGIWNGVSEKLPSFAHPSTPPAHLLNGELGAVQFATEGGLVPFSSARSGTHGAAAVGGAAGGGRGSGAVAQLQHGAHQQQRRRQGGWSA